MAERERGEPWVFPCSGNRCVWPTERPGHLTGADIHTEHDPYQAGLGWTVDLGDRDFIGADRCRSLVGSKPNKRLRTLVVDSADVLVYEAVLHQGELSPS